MIFVLTTMRPSYVNQEIDRQRRYAARTSGCALADLDDLRATAEESCPQGENSLSETSESNFAPPQSIALTVLSDEADRTARLVSPA